MTRIKVTPEQLEQLSQQFAGPATELGALTTRLGSALTNLDIEIDQKALVQSQWTQASKQAVALTQKVQEMSKYVGRKAQIFKDADAKDVADIQAIVDNYPPPTSSPIPEDPRQQVFSRLKELDGLKPEVWRNLSIEEKQKVLETAHSMILEAYGVSPVAIRKENLNDNLLGTVFGYRPKKGEMNPGGDDEGTGVCVIRYIAIDEAVYNSSNPMVAVQTIAHETRHVIQAYAVEHPDIAVPGVSSQMLALWTANFMHYKDADKQGLREYANQPLETDAFVFGDEASIALYGTKPW